MSATNNYRRTPTSNNTVGGEDNNLLDYDQNIRVSMIDIIVKCLIKREDQRQRRLCEGLIKYKDWEDHQALGKTAHSSGFGMSDDTLAFSKTSINKKTSLREGGGAGDHQIIKFKNLKDPNMVRVCLPQFIMHSS